MDSGSLSSLLRVLIFSLLGALHHSNGNKNDCPCQPIPPLALTEPPSEECFRINSSFRYTCVPGYVRKAGTSNLIRCKEGGVWTTPSLSCIRDPKITTTITIQPPDPTTPSSSQKTYTASTSASTLQGRTEPTTFVLQSQSDYTQDSVNVISEAAWKSSIPPSTFQSNNSQNYETMTGLGSKTTAILLSASFGILVFIGISVFFYRRRTTDNILPQAAEEVIPINHLTS
ncbi:interleukin-15 receptor subunit alpha isoform 1-T1 [Aulostomus maculatus]